MCDLPVCAESCKHAATWGATAGVLLGCALAWEVADVVVVPAVRAVAVGVVVAVAAVLGALAVLAVLRLRRRRAVLSRGVLRTAGVTAAAIPAAGVPLALAAGAALWTGPLTVTAGWVLGRFAWSCMVRPMLEMRRPGAYEKLRALPVRVPVRPLPPGARRVAATVTVLSRRDERAVR